MHYGQKLANVVGAVHWAVVKYLLPCGQIHAAVLHGARVARASCVHGQGVGLDLGWQRQHGVVSPVGWGWRTAFWAGGRLVAAGVGRLFGIFCALAGGVGMGCTACTVGLGSVGKGRFGLVLTLE